MKNLKRVLALALALCMMCSFLPVGALAAGADAPTITGTSDAPFKQGTGGSNSFRIPALVTLSDGTLVAAADARWNTTYDGGGLDTMVAVSGDNGNTWTHSFANYLGDNGNAYNGSSSTCFIDPSLVVYTTDEDNDGTPEDAIYMLCDLYPYGVALNGEYFEAPSTVVGFTDEGYLKLGYNSATDLQYYLKEGRIYSASNNAVINNYEVDEHFNIVSTAYGVDTNLFYADSPFKVARTGFLYLTKSTDGGKSWSAPQLLNLKTGNEQVCLVGPGRGAVVYNDGTPYIVFPVYSYNGGESSQRLSFVYSADGGATWKRSANLNYTWASESAVVELDENNMRFFFRNGSSTLMYVDYNWTNGWGTPQSTGIATNSNTQISAIRTQQTINEESVILVSCPGSSSSSGSNQSGASYRTNGKIFLFTLGENNAMTHKKTLDVPSVHSANSFMYSCMTMLTDKDGNETGDVAILYEDQQSRWGTGEDCYYQMSYKTFSLEDDFGITFDEDENTDIDVPGDGGESYEKSITLKVGETFNETVADIYAESGSKITDIAAVTWVGTTTEGETTEVLTAATLPTSTGSIQAYITDGNGNFLSLSGSSLTNVTEIAAATKWTLTYVDTPSWGNGASRYTVSAGSYKVQLSNGALNATTGTDNTNHYFTADAGFYGSSNGSNAWIYNNGWTIGTANNNAAKAYTLETVTGGETSSSTAVTITGRAVGTTTVTIGDAITYTITVNAANVTNTVDVELKVGETSETYTNTTGSDIVKNTDSTIASMKVDVVPGVTETTVSTTKATELEAGATYIIRVTGTNQALTSNTGGTTWGDSDGETRAFETFNAAEDDNMWTLEASGNGYKLKCAAGYLNLGKNAAWIDDMGEAFTLTYSNGVWAIGDGTYNIDTLGGLETYHCAGGWPNSGTRFDLYKVTVATPASTTVSFTGKNVGTTTAIVGDTQYNITVTCENVVDVNLKVGESKTFTDESGNHENNIVLAPDADIASMTVKGTTSAGDPIVTPVTALTTGDTFYIQVSEGVYRTADLGTTTNLADAEQWKVSSGGTDWGVVQNSANQVLAIVSNQPALVNYTYYVWMNNGQIGDDFGNVTIGTPVKATATETVEATEITFTGKNVGTTTAIVGNTQYNITVNSADISQTVDIEVEIGEDFTYTDTTGNYVDYEANTEPDGTYATMAVAGTANSTQKKLVPVTAATFETGKRYVIENVRTANPDHAAYQPGNSVLTSSEVVGGAIGLQMNGPLDVNSSQTWSFTPSDNMYHVGRNNEYINLSNGNATMETGAQSLSFEYIEGSGWLIYYNTDGNNISNDGDYFLSDMYGTGSGEAFGYNDKDDDGNYWNIYEVVEETLSDATKVTFHGVAEGTTTAIVGNTQYNIKVVPADIDDEVVNSATGIWTVDPEIQRNEYNSIVNGKHKDLYTDDSWKQYEAARQAAYKKLVEVSNAKYTSETAANAALDELEELVDALKTAADKLVGATTISVRYHLNTTDGTLLDTKEYKINTPALVNGQLNLTGTTLDLPDTIVVNNIAYEVSDTTLELQGAETSYDVVVTKIGALGGGFVASADITAGTHNGHSQVADLVDDNGANPKKITEMTLTVGIDYNLDLAIEMKDGYTVEWIVENTDTVVATVDADGKVTAVAPGTTNVIATVKDADGNIVEVNSMPVNVFPKGSGDRKTAIYIEEVESTTVWCVVNGDTQNYGFEVVEGELIYGQFDTAVSDRTNTSALSFFGDPDEAHALVYMKSTNSDDHYFLLHDDDGNLYDGTASGNASSNYYVSGVTSGAGYWQAVGLSGNQTGANTPGWSIIKDMVQWAIDLGCDGGLGFTRRQSEGALASNLSFKSNPLPRIEKEVDGVLPTSRKQADYRRYVENMVAAVQELVYFKITVIQEAPTEWKPQVDSSNKIVRDENGNVVIVRDENGNPYGAIEYSTAMVTDTVLPGAYLYTKELDQADGTYDGEIAEGNRVQEDDITNELNSAWTQAQIDAGKRAFEYYLVYEIQESDIPKFWIDNIANLSYGYQSYYSTGAQAAAADAEARISVVGSAIDNVVIDFGQTFTYQSHEFTSITDGQTYTFTGLRNAHLKGAYVDGKNDFAGITKSKASAKYGEVSVTRVHLKDENGNLLYDSKGYPEYEYLVTYTPTSILLEPDAVIIYGMGENNREKIINGFMVYPATTVYYEEGFLFQGDETGWTGNIQKATGEQTFELLGASFFDNHGVLTKKVSNNKHAYGFDPLYEKESYDYGDSEAIATAVGTNTTFTFTGTGFDLYANCTMESGYVAVQVKDIQGKTVKMYTVDTVVLGGSSDATNFTEDDEFHLPIVSEQDLPHGTYTVTLRKVKDSKKDVKIDGVRIFNTVPVENTSIYNIDLEDNPEFYQLRDMVLSAINVGDSDVYGTLDEMVNQVYGKLTTDTEQPLAVVTSADKIYVDKDNANPADPQDLLDNGPKNELFLYKGQTLTFNVTTSRAMQIGLKAPRTGTRYNLSYKIGDATTTVASDEVLNTSVDMFYELGNPIGTAKTYTVTVTNTGDDILSITDLKICDDPSAAFVPLTAEDIETILIDLGYTDGSTEEPIDPSNPYSITYTQASISLAGDIGLNYYATLSEALMADEGAYMVFTMDGEQQTFPMSNCLISTANDGTKTYRFSCAVPARMMAENVVAQMYTSQGIAVGEGKAFSVKTYCDKVIEAYADSVQYANLISLMKAMLNYGGYSQIKFGYNTDNLANADLTDISLPEITGADLDSFAHGKSGEEPGISIQSVSLLLESTTTIRYYFQLDGTRSIEEFTFLVDSEAVEPVHYSGNTYYVDKVGVSARNLDVNSYVTVGGLSVWYSGMSYVRQVLRNNTDTALINVCKALYAYSEAANTYFGA